MNKKRIKVFFIFLMLVLTLPGCDTASNPITILETNCALPCWNGITPRQTSKKDLLAILANIDTVDQKSIMEMAYGNGNKAIRLNTQGFLRSNSMRISFLDDIVVAIFFTGVNTNFGKLTELTGEPEYFFAWEDRGGKQIKIINITKGIWFIAKVDDVNMVTAKTPVDMVELFDPVGFQQKSNNAVNYYPYRNFDELQPHLLKWSDNGRP